MTTEVTDDDGIFDLLISGYGGGDMIIEKVTVLEGSAR